MIVLGIRTAAGMGVQIPAGAGSVYGHPHRCFDKQTTYSISPWVAGVNRPDDDSWEHYWFYKDVLRNETSVTLPAASKMYGMVAVGDGPEDRPVVPNECPLVTLCWDEASEPRFHYEYTPGDWSGPSAANVYDAFAALFSSPCRDAVWPIGGRASVRVATTNGQFMDIAFAVHQVIED